MKKLLCLLVILLGLGRICFSQADYDSCIVYLTRKQMLDELARYSQDWKNDSLAKGGFRKFIGREFFRCSGDSLVGIKWSELHQYLGKPHFSFHRNKYSYMKEGEVKYRYVLFAYRSYRDFKDLGNIILDISVINGIVDRIGVQENDG